MAGKATGSIRCGWCMTGDHDQCKSEISYFDKIWYCSCVECHPDRKSEVEGESPTSED